VEKKSFYSGLGGWLRFPKPLRFLVQTTRRYTEDGEEEHRLRPIEVYRWAMATVMLADLLDRHFAERRREEEPQNGWQQWTVRFVAARYGLPKKQQREVLAMLQAEGLLEVKTKGRPPMRFVKLRLDRIRAFLTAQREAQTEAIRRSKRAEGRRRWARGRKKQRRSV